jgi:SET domain
MEQQDSSDVWAVFGSDSSSASDTDDSDRCVNAKPTPFPPFVTFPHIVQVFENPPEHGVVSRGKGLRCLQSYKKGDEILREEPTIRISNFHAASSRQEAEEMHRSNLVEAFDALPSDIQEYVLALSICGKHSSSSNVDSSTVEQRLEGIYQTNSYRLSEENGEQTFGGLFLTVARINHNCRPNVSHYWRSDLNRLLLFATCDIEKGDELHLSYLSPAECQDTRTRRACLRKDFSFHCTCEMCSEGNVWNGDDRMVELGELMELLPEVAAMGEDDESVCLVEHCLLLLQQQGLDQGAFTKKILSYGYQLSSDHSIAQKYLERQLTAVVESEGVGCPNSLRLEKLLDVTRSSKDCVVDGFNKA